MREIEANQWNPYMVAPPSYEKRLGEIIRQGRKSLGLTQSALADILEVSQQTVSKWESKRATPDVSMFPAIAEALEIPDFGSVNLAGTPILSHIPNNGLRESLTKFRHIVMIRETPWLMPQDLHSNPIDVERNGWASHREQVAYEVARILATALDLDEKQTMTVQFIIWILSCVPGGSVEDIPLFLWSEEARRHMMGFAQGKAGYDSKAGILLAICEGDTREEYNDLYATLSPVVANPYVMRRVSSIWHPMASDEAMLRERDARNECFSARDYEPEEIILHARRIASWDGRRDCSRLSFEEAVPVVINRLAQERLSRGASWHSIITEFIGHPNEISQEIAGIPAMVDLLCANCHNELTASEMDALQRGVICYATQLESELPVTTEPPLRGEPEEDEFDDLFEEIDYPDELPITTLLEWAQGKDRQ